MRTIGRHWPSTAPAWDVQSRCDYCGVPFRRSQLYRDLSGMLACKLCGNGKCSAQLDMENAEAAARDSLPEIFVEGNIDTSQKKYATTPSGILGSKILGWWNSDGVVVSGTPDDYMHSYYNPIGSDDYLYYQALVDESSLRSGVTRMRNKATKYDSNGVYHKERYGHLDFTSAGIYSPAYVDRAITFDATGSNPYFSWRRLEANYPRFIRAGTNPCVWIVYKPLGNLVESSTNPDDHVQFSVLFNSKPSKPSWPSISGVNGYFSLVWGRTETGYISTSDACWNARARYATAGYVKVYGDEVLNTDTARRVYSVRMEDDRLVLKVADTEWEQAITAGDSMSYDNDWMGMGELLNGEISAVVLTASVPDDDEISELEAYFKKMYPDIEEAL